MTDTVSGNGRPLRFLLIVMLCWTGGRIAMTQDWATPVPIDAAPQFARTATPNLRPKRSISTQAMTMASLVPDGIRAPPRRATPSRPDTPQAGGAMDNKRLLDYLRFSIAFANRTSAPAIRGGPESIADIPGRGMQMPLPGTAFSLSKATDGPLGGSAWLFWRDSGDNTLAAGAGQLGGAQAGARISYQLMPGQPDRLTAYVRATSALRRPSAREVAMGFAFQAVSRLPVRVTVERRADLGDGGRNAFAAGIVGGHGPAPIVGAMTVEAYGQAGVVGMKRRDAYVDGKLSVMHPLPDIRPVTVGLSLSGGAQPQVARVDIGPQIEARLRLGNSPARLSAEWRERVAGNARPGSGVAITLATDF